MRNLALRCSLAVLVSLFAVAAAPRPVLPPPEKQQWVRVRLEGYDIYTNAGTRTAREVATSVHRMTGALSKSIGLKPLPYPVRIFVFARTSQFAPYAHALLGASDGRIGICATAPDATYIVVDGSRSYSTNAIYHELTHALLGRTRIAVPLWISEGIAGFYETLEIHRKRVRIGTPKPSHLMSLQTQPLFPTRDLLELKGSDEDVQRGARIGQIYAQSWAMVHYLLIGKGADPATVPAILQNLSAGDSRVDAFTKAVGMTPEDFDDALRLYLRRPGYPYVEFEIDTIEPAVAVAEPVSRAQIVAELAEVLVRGSRFDEARNFIDLAHSLDPANARAFAAEGYLLSASRKFDEARAAYERARELDPSDRAVTMAFQRLERGARLRERMATGEHVRDEEERIERLRAALATAPPDQRERIQRAIGEREERLRQRRLYADARSFANAGRVDDAMKLLDELIAGTEAGSPLRRAAEELHAELARNAPPP